MKKITEQTDGKNALFVVNSALNNKNKRAIIELALKQKRDSFVASLNAEKAGG